MKRSIRCSSKKFDHHDWAVHFEVRCSTLASIFFLFSFDFESPESQVCSRCETTRRSTEGRGVTIICLHLHSIVLHSGLMSRFVTSCATGSFGF